MADKIILKGYPNQLKPLITHLIAVRELLEEKDIGTFFVDDKFSPPVKRRGRPRVFLYFQQDTNFKPTGTQSTVPHGRRRRDGVISFRLMDETPTTFTEANQKAIANKIKQIFGANGGFVWTKGKDMYNYTDWDMGYQLELLCRTETEARRLITAVLSVQNHTPDWAKLTHSEASRPDAKYPILPPKKVIAGKEVQLIEQRPIVDVRFRYSYASVEGLIDPISLYDRTAKLKNVAVI